MYNNIVSYYNGNDLITRIINKKEVIARYQPIISLTKKCIVGFEGLSRGINKFNGEIISPLKMFNIAKDENKTVQLDRLCREKCIEGFKEIYEKNDDIYLFLNIEASIIEKVEGSNFLLQQIGNYNISPRNVVIEINEAQVENLESLKRFINHYKSLGFLIALDDVGSGFSNFERIAITKPDIIKLDRTLVSGIESSFYKQEIFKSLVGLSNKIGAVVVAEGVENEKELNAVIEYGAHLVQGYFFSKPELFNNILISEFNNRVRFLADKYMKLLKAKIKKEKCEKKLLDKAISNVILRLKEGEQSGFDSILEDFINESKDLNIECAYILDKKGIQISDTVFLEKIKNERKGLMFYPLANGANNSLKKYYIDLINYRLTKYISEPYISCATGNICVTVSRTFKDLNNNKLIFCVDIINANNI